MREHAAAHGTGVRPGAVVDEFVTVNPRQQNRNQPDNFHCGLVFPLTTIASTCTPDVKLGAPKYRR